MGRHLNLVESDFEKLEKRILPSFPFCYLIFKKEKGNDHVYEVRDISHSGMQLALKSGGEQSREGEELSGELHWYGKTLQVAGNVKWAKDNRMGVEFLSQPKMRQAVDSFLEMENFAQSLKPLHQPKLGLELPANLKYWLRSDGPVEIFIWQHNNGELASFQILIMENFIEWKDTKGLTTGRVISKRDIDTPLINEDEFVFKLDPAIDDNKIDKARKLVGRVDNDKLSQETLDFLLMKLGQ